MNILNELTLKNLKRNKKRTLVTMFGILLSVALVTAITTFVSSMQQSLMERAIKYNGNYHIMINDVPKEQQKYILNNAKVKETMIVRNIGNVSAETFLTKEAYEDIEKRQVEPPQIKLKAMDKKEMQKLSIGVNLRQGKLPKDETEVLYPLNLDGYGKTYRTGDTITLNVDGTEKTYRISGIIMPLSFDFRTAEGNRGYTFYTAAQSENDKAGMDMAILLKEPKEAYHFYEELINEHGFEKSSLITNDSLLRFQGVTKSDSTMKALYSIAGIVILIIMFTSVFVIKNSFDISVTERLRQYGMLSSVGATSGQIRKNVMFEGLVLGITAIPLGILSGIFAIGVTLKIVMKILENSSLAEEFTLSLHISGWAIVIAVIVAVITIYLSALIPAGKAAKISPIEAIRETNSIRLSAKKLKTSGFIGHIFGVEGEIANKNLKRSRKKYRTTVFSIFLSVVLFISISSMVKYGFMLQEMEWQKRDYNLEVHMETGDMKREEEYALLEKIGKMDGVKRSRIVKSFYSEMENGDYTKEALGTEERGKFSAEELDANVMLCVYAIPDEEYRAYLKEIGLSVKEAEGKIIINDVAQDEYYDKGNQLKRVKYHMLNSKAGDKLTVRLSEDQKKKATWEIAKKTDKMPFGIEHVEVSKDITAVISDKMMNKLEWSPNGIKIDAKDSTKLQKEIKESNEKIQWYFTDYDAMVKENNSLILIVSIFLYGFIAVISVIGITNVFNTITTNMTLRSREFAILKSVGMTDKEFRKMIRCESILYGMKALIFGIPAGVALSYLMYRQFVGIVMVPYTIPWKQIGIASLSVFVIIFMTMGYSVRKTKDQNIIETIRSENV